MVALSNGAFLAAAIFAFVAVDAFHVEERMAVSAGARNSLRGEASGASAEAGGAIRPTWTGPQLNPKQFLIVSSPTEKKVVYTELRNFKSVHGRTFPLVDSALQEPSGISFDHERNLLYVADRAAQTIFRYRIKMQKDTTSDGTVYDSLVTDGKRLTVLTGHRAEWVAVGSNGDIFFSDQGSNSISKLTTAVMEKIAIGEFAAEDLSVYSEKMRQAAEAVEAANALSEEIGALPTDPPPIEPHVFSMFEGSLNPHVSTPAGLASDGIRVFWTNSLGGTTSGSVVEAEANPKQAILSSSSAEASGGTEPAPYPATPLSKVSDVSYGLAKSNTLVFFSSAAEGAGTVFGVSANGGPTTPIVTGLVSPRGLAWDGDGTVYVADETQNTVWSFPAGQLVESVPLTATVAFDAPFGLAVVSGEGLLRSGALGLRGSGGGVLTALAVAFLSARAAASPA